MTTGQLAPLVSVEVSTQISGLITEVDVDFNTPVKKGQTLARIDPATYQQVLYQAQANLKSGQANAALAKLTADRQKDLAAKHLVAQQDSDQAQALLEQAQATLLTQQSTVKSAQLDLDRCTITSPIDGIVIYKAADVGKTVQASFTAPTLFVIAKDLRKMQIIASISEVDVWSVKPGQPVTFNVEALPDRAFKGTLRQIRNPYTPSEKQTTQQQPGSNPIAMFDAVIEVENPDLVLMPSLTANVSVVILQHKNVLRLPNSALRVQMPPPGGTNPTEAPSAPKPEKASPEAPAPGTAIAYRLPKGDRSATPEKIVIHTDITDSIMTEVTSGLAEGDTVVTGVIRPPYTYHGLFF